MCGVCGCHKERTPESGQHNLKHRPPAFGVEIMQNILSENDHVASHNREYLKELGLVAFNLMSSPGAGKTRLLEETAKKLGTDRVAVIEGDLETENDAQRLRTQGVQAFQITTGMSCHLNASMVEKGIKGLDLSKADYLFIENVGNLICPANFDLGQKKNIVLLSVTEGDDKPEKYPVMFESADVVLITKTDLLPHMDEFSLARAKESIRNVNPRAVVMELSSKSMNNFEQWLQWIGENRT